MTSGATATSRTTVRVRLAEALTISEDVQPTASTAPKKPAAAGTMPASRWPNSGTYMSTIVAAISSPIVTYIHFERTRAERRAGQHRRLRASVDDKKQRDQRRHRRPAARRWRRRLAARPRH